MSYIIHKPSGVLAEYIKCIWILEEGYSCSQNFCSTLIPSGSIEIIFHFGGKGKYLDNNNQDYLITNNSVTGQRSKSSTYHSNGTKGILAVMLQPAKANLLIGHPANTLSNKTYDIESIIGNSIKQLLEKLNDSKSSFERIQHTVCIFTERIKKIQKYIDPRLKEFEIQVSRSGGNVNINDLAYYLNTSKRQLERKVLEVIGLTPKEFSRIIRFQKALYLKQLNKNLNITDLAYECGFSDQAHFINDFKAISGYSPKRYFEITDSFSDYYTYN